MRYDPRSVRGEFFVAAKPPKDIANRLYEAFGMTRREHSDDDMWDWKTPAHYHVTLAIAGDMPIEQLGTLEAIIKNLDADCFTTEIPHIGHFLKNANNHSNRHVLWAGFDMDGHIGFHLLHKELDMAFKTRHLPQRQRKFEPHMTVARPQNPVREALKSVVENHDGFKTLGNWDVTGVSIFQRLPREWQQELGLPSRFHEVIHHSFETGKTKRVGRILLPNSRGGVLNPFSP